MLAAAQAEAALQARLTGLASTGPRAFVGRQYPVTEAELPCWRISKGDEDIEIQTIHFPALQQHVLELRAEGLLRAVDGLDGEMDAMVAEALTALHATQPPYQLVVQRVSRSVSRRDGEAAVGVVALTVTATFRTRQGAPEIIL